MNHPLVAAAWSDSITVWRRGELLALQGGLMPALKKAARSRASRDGAPVTRPHRLVALPALQVCPDGELWVGADEAGRGPLAGPVVACACGLPPGWAPPGLADSKLLTARQREALVPGLLERASLLSVAVAPHTVVDRINVLRASLRAMAAAVQSLPPGGTRVWVDGLMALPLPLRLRQTPQPHADRDIACVAAASVIAKWVRDAMMDLLDEELPQYGFAHNKGYPTAEHLEALERYGPSPLHRRSFRPVAQARLDVS